jgi:hypothetical protein
MSSHRETMYNSELVYLDKRNDGVHKPYSIFQKNGLWLVYGEQ